SKSPVQGLLLIVSCHGLTVVGVPVVGVPDALPGACASTGWHVTATISAPRRQARRVISISSFARAPQHEPLAKPAIGKQPAPMAEWWPGESWYTPSPLKCHPTGLRPLFKVKNPRLLIAHSQ